MARTYSLPVPRRLPLQVPVPVLHGLLLLLMVSGPLTAEIILPALPAIGTAFGLPLTQVQLIISAFMLGYALAQLLVGPLADRIGRRPVLLIGLSMYVLAGIAGALATTLPLLLTARLFQGMSISVAPVLARVIVRDLYDTPRASRLLAYLGAIMAIGPGLAPIVGGVINQLWGWRAILFLLLGFGLAIFAMSLILAPETRPHVTAEPARRGGFTHAYRFLIGQPAYMRNLLGLMLLFATMYSFFAGLPTLITVKYDLPETVIGPTFAVAVTGYILGGLTLGRLSGRVAETVLFQIGFGVAGLALILFAGLSLIGQPPFTLIILCISLYTFGYGILTAPLTVRTLGLFPQYTGSAAALLGCSEWLGTAVISWLAVQLLSIALLPMALLLLTMLACAWALTNRIG
jgi:DHA1 family bicyclomycin/chloramphenicol resistance-like MFS transporter